MADKNVPDTYGALPTEATEIDLSITDDQMMAELGATGLKRWSGLIYEEYLQELSGQQAIRVWAEMSNDATVRAALRVIELYIRQVEWHVEGGTPEGQEFIKSCLDDMEQSFADVVSEILSMLVYGWSYHEVIYKRREGWQEIAYDEEARTVTSQPSSNYDDGKIGWHSWAIRSQDSLLRWEFDEVTGDVLGMWQIPPPHYQPVFIPITKAALFRTTSHKGNPEGQSILRGAYRAWYFKKRIEEIEAVGIERDLAGLPMMKIPADYFSPDASAEKKAIFSEAQQIITQVRRDESEGVLLPMARDSNGNELFSFELLSTGGARQFDTSGIVARYDQRIAMSMLADFLLLGSGAVGSFALSDDKTDVFAVAIGAWLDVIESVINRQILPTLLRLNGIDTEDMPRIAHGDLETPELGQVASYLGALASIGIPLLPDETLENYLREIANLPAKPEDEEVVPPSVWIQQAMADAGVGPQAQMDGEGPQSPPKGPNPPSGSGNSGKDKTKAQGGSEKPQAAQTPKKPDPTKGEKVQQPRQPQPKGGKS